MSKHTPGEWNAFQLSSDSDEQERWIITANDELDEVTGYIDKKEDAFLISAAPDMLELLESLHNHSTIAEGIRIAAVIDKAKGGQA